MNQPSQPYQLVKGPDGLIYVAIDPLMNAIKDSVINLMDLQLPETEEDLRNQKLMGLKATYEILGALLQEAKLNEFREEHATLQ